MSDVTYVTDGPWGTGTGAPHTANSADTNFWVLYSLILALQDAAPDTIAYFTVTGNQMWITMSDHYVFGPFTLPTAAFNWRGGWQPNTAYAINDVFTVGGSVYLVVYPQVSSGATFYALSNDGLGHNNYTLMLAAPPSELPDNGLPGQFLQWTVLDSPGGVVWAYINRPVGFYFEEPPNPLEVVCRYTFVESTQFPVGLVGSEGSVGTGAVEAQDYELYQNGASIGSVNFRASPSDTPTFTFPNTVTFHAGDVLAVVAPSVIDPHLTGISFTLMGHVVLP